MKIREMIHDDYQAIHDLISNEMQHDEVSFDKMSEWLDIMRADKNQLLYVAESNGVVIGFISALKSIGCIDGFYIDISCIVVSASFQGNGVGKMLLQFIEGHGQSEGIISYSTTSGFHRTKAHAFFESNQYERGGLAFYKGLVILSTLNNMDNSI